jgi:hypothetical protein
MSNNRLGNSSALPDNSWHWKRFASTRTIVARAGKCNRRTSKTKTVFHSPGREENDIQERYNVVATSLRLTGISASKFLSDAKYTVLTRRTHLRSTNVVVQQLFVNDVSRQRTIFKALNKLRQAYSPWNNTCQQSFANVLNSWIPSPGDWLKLHIAKHRQIHLLCCSRATTLLQW